MEPYRNRDLGKHIQRIGCQPKKTTYTVANPARGLLNRGKKKRKKKSGSAPASSVCVVRDTGSGYRKRYSATWSHRVCILVEV